MLAYIDKEEAENVADGKRYYLKHPITLDGETYESIVVARGSTFGMTTGIFADDKLVLEEKSREAALASLVLCSDNMRLRAELKDDEQEIKNPD